MSFDGSGGKMLSVAYLRERSGRERSCANVFCNRSRNENNCHHAYLYRKHELELPLILELEGFGHGVGIEGYGAEVYPSSWLCAVGRWAEEAAAAKKTVVS